MHHLENDVLQVSILSAKQGLFRQWSTQLEYLFLERFFRAGMSKVSAMMYLLTRETSGPLSSGTAS